MITLEESDFKLACSRELLSCVKKEIWNDLPTTLTEPFKRIIRSSENGYIYFEGHNNNKQIKNASALVTTFNKHKLVHLCVARNNNNEICIVEAKPRFFRVTLSSLLTWKNKSPFVNSYQILTDKYIENINDRNYSFYVLAWHLNRTRSDSLEYNDNKLPTLDYKHKDAKIRPKLLIVYSNKSAERQVDAITLYRIGMWAGYECIYVNENDLENKSFEEITPNITFAASFEDDLTNNQRFKDLFYLEKFRKKRLLVIKNSSKTSGEHVSLEELRNEDRLQDIVNKISIDANNLSHINNSHVNTINTCVTLLNGFINSADSIDQKLLCNIIEPFNKALDIIGKDQFSWEMNSQNLYLGIAIPIFENAQKLYLMNSSKFTNFWNSDDYQKVKEKYLVKVKTIRLHIFDNVKDVMNNLKNIKTIQDYYGELGKNIITSEECFHNWYRNRKSDFSKLDKKNAFPTNDEVFLELKNETIKGGWCHLQLNPQQVLYQKYENEPDLYLLKLFKELEDDRKYSHQSFSTHGSKDGLKTKNTNELNCFVWNNDYISNKEKLANEIISLFKESISGETNIELIPHMCGRSYVKHMLLFRSHKQFTSNLVTILSKEIYEHIKKNFIKYQTKYGLLDIYSGGIEELPGLDQIGRINRNYMAHDAIIVMIFRDTESLKNYYSSSEEKDENGVFYLLYKRLGELWGIWTKDQASKQEILNFANHFELTNSTLIQRLDYLINNEYLQSVINEIDNVFSK